ncbi:hypothetical protein J4729_05255 [Leisingera sp. HS039]|uniref:hypothetical protein n=1 Tax=unclassified Leisingera TaxID=2614906 RepID=UPI001070F542|nr:MULTISPECIES: hypothetical protein [unclassified Leisingera]MBQ4823957.1 hypothetical protein [Leisingera sp. HS039]QBR38243.1 hypothetical protein ETW23_21170 [Leisingera sp. NJS201]
MAPKHSDDFKREAVRIATSSGLTRRQVASERFRSFPSKIGVVKETGDTLLKGLEGLLWRLAKGASTVGPNEQLLPFRRSCRDAVVFAPFQSIMELEGFLRQRATPEMGTRSDQGQRYRSGANSTERA